MRPEDAVEEVEKVAALLHKGATRVGGKAVPVADLLQEWEAMFADGDHARVSHDSVLCVCDYAGDGGHVRIFEAYKSDALALASG